MNHPRPKLKVLAFAPLYLPFLGGIEVLLGNILPLLKARGIETAVVCESAEGLPEREVMNGITVHRLPLSAAVRARNAVEPLRVVQALKAIIAEEKPDLLHMHSVAQAASFYVDRILSQAGQSLPVYVSLHGALEAEDQLQVVLNLLRRANAVSGVSNACLESAAAFLLPGAPTRLIYNGIPATDLLCEPWRQGEVAQLLCVGRLQLEKGYDLAIRALGLLSARGLPARLRIIGRGVERQRFEALARDLGLASQVEFLGEHPPAEVRQHMARSHALLAPSRMREGFGLVVAEAAWMGVPAIVSDAGGLPEVALDGRTGHVFPREDHNRLADAIGLAFSSGNHWLKLSAQAREHVRARFRLDDCVNGYIKFYQDFAGH